MIGNGEPLFVIPEGVETRWASFENPTGDRGRGGGANGGRKGAPCKVLKAGEQVVLAEASGAAGTVRRIWATTNDRAPRMLRGLRVDCYWDGADHPAVSAPLGDFFATGPGRLTPSTWTGRQTAYRRWRRWRNASPGCRDTSRRGETCLARRTNERTAGVPVSAPSFVATHGRASAGDMSVAPTSCE